MVEWRNPTREEQAELRNRLIMLMREKSLTHSWVAKRCKLSWNTIDKFIDGSDMAWTTLNKIEQFMEDKNV